MTCGIALIYYGTITLYPDSARPENEKGGIL